jgi:hypothetical protein
MVDGSEAETFGIEYIRSLPIPVYSAFRHFGIEAFGTQWCATSRRLVRQRLRDEVVVLMQGDSDSSVLHRKASALQTCVSRDS